MAPPALPAEALSAVRAQQGREQRHALLRELGVEKLGHRLALIASIDASVEASDLGDVSTAPPAALAAALRVAFVCHTGYFQGGFGGATRASLAMLREARRLHANSARGGVDVLALTSRPQPEGLAHKLGDKRALGVLRWEGLEVLVGEADELQAAAAARPAPYHVVIALSIEARKPPHHPKSPRGA